MSDKKDPKKVKESSSEEESSSREESSEEEDDSVEQKKSEPTKKTEEPKKAEELKTEKVKKNPKVKQSNSKEVTKNDSKSSERTGMSRTKTGLDKESIPAKVPKVRTNDKLLESEAKFFNIILMTFQVAIIVIYAVWADYHDEESIASASLQGYGYFRDVNIMIFFGFGLLMCFLRRYGYSAIGYTLLISAMVVQWSIPLQGIVEFEKHEHKLKIGVFELVNGLFCAGSVMISYGAILGKVSPVQMVLLGIIEPIFYWLNIYIVISLLGGYDVGGGMTIHTFGAYFGLALTWFLTSKETRSHKDNTSSYSSDLFSLAGTLFLWIMWPSFNAAVAPTKICELRAITNTFLSITSSTMASFIVSRILSENKFDIVHIQNSTLAGGVAMGVAAHLNLAPAAAIGIGFVAGSLSVWGYKYLTPYISSKFNIQDICGINNLHGMPGILSCLVGIFASLRAKENRSLYPTDVEFNLLFPKGETQAGYQTAGLIITIGIAIVGGIFTGILMKLAHRVIPIVKKDYFNDRTFWNLPSDYDNVIDRTSDDTTSIELKEMKP